MEISQSKKANLSFFISSVVNLKYFSTELMWSVKYGISSTPLPMSLWSGVLEDVIKFNLQSYQQPLGLDFHSLEKEP